MTKELSICLLLLLSGCEKSAKDAPATSRVVDQEVRRKVFIDCLDHAPAGPVATKYNDWAEVVDACANQAYYIALQDSDLLPAMREQKVEK